MANEAHTESDRAYSKCYSRHYIYGTYVVYAKVATGLQIRQDRI
jgi:hypothetical protein